LSKKRFIEDDSQSSEVCLANGDSGSGLLEQVDRMMEEYGYDTQSFAQMTRVVSKNNGK